MCYFNEMKHTRCSSYDNNGGWGWTTSKQVLWDQPGLILTWDEYKIIEMNGELDSCRLYSHIYIMTLVV